MRMRRSVSMDEQHHSSPGQLVDVSWVIALVAVIGFSGYLMYRRVVRI